MIRKIVLAFTIFLIIIVIIYLGYYFFKRFYFEPQLTIREILEKRILYSNRENFYEIIFENLEIPWNIVFIDKNRILVTERPGKIKIISLEDKKLIQEFYISEVKHVGEGGLLGAAVHPYFSQNNLIYFYYTTKKNGLLFNRVERYKLIRRNSESKKETYDLVKDKVIVDEIPGGVVHNGGRIKFGPDGYLYITTGDAGDSSRSQDISSLAGKILRVEDDGDIPEDNPFGNLIYAYGIRNSQGMSWDNLGNLWVIDHGRSGIKSGLDEINLINKGKNYGWPIIQGSERKENMEAPIIHSGEEITWAPADLVYYNGNLFFTGLRGQGLYQYNIQTGRLVVHFFKQFGRLRAITLGPDNNFYISTSNRDGRGFPRKGDDKIIKINSLKLFEEEIKKTIIIDTPQPNEIIRSPIIIKGKAKGIWFFEATFPIILVDWNGKVIAESYVTAKSNWMTEDFVSFEGKLEFKNQNFFINGPNNFFRRGTIIFKNANPSGLPENQFHFELPVIFGD